MDRELKNRILDMYADQRQNLVGQIDDKDDVDDQRMIAHGIAEDLGLTTTEVLRVIRAKRWE